MFFTLDNRAVGRVDPITGTTINTAGLEVGNINSVDGSGYSVADEELAGLKAMELTPFAHEEQVNIGDPSGM